MKRLIPCFVLMSVCVSISFGSFDYTISNTYEGAVDLSNESLLVTGAGALQIIAWGSSYIEVQKTAPLVQGFGGIYDLLLGGYSTINYYGGETGGFSIYNNATATFSGGRVDYISSYQYVSVSQPHMEFVVKDYNHNNLTNILTGHWANDTAFTTQLLNQSGYSPVIDNIKFTIIPEPATIALLAVGGLLLRKRV